MSNQNISVYGDFVIIEVLAVNHAITHKHRNTVEFQALNLDTGVAQVMHIVIKAADVGAIQTIIVVATDENLVAIRQVTEPVQEIDRFPFASDHAEVAGVYHNIGLREINQPMMAAMSVREMKDGQNIQIETVSLHFLANWYLFAAKSRIVHLQENLSKINKNSQCRFSLTDYFHR